MATIHHGHRRPALTGRVGVTAQTALIIHRASAQWSLHWESIDFNGNVAFKDIELEHFILIVQLNVN